MLKHEVDNKAVVSLTEARRYYEKNPKEFEHGETFACRRFRFCPGRCQPGDDQDTRKRAEGILEQAKATKNYEQFGLLAEKVSEDDYQRRYGRP